MASVAWSVKDFKDSDPGQEESHRQTNGKKAFGSPKHSGNICPAKSCLKKS